MKKLLTFAVLIGYHTFAFGQGTMLWNNTFNTLISTAATGGSMPFRVSPETTYLSVHCTLRHSGAARGLPGN